MCNKSNSRALPAGFGDMYQELCLDTITSSKRSGNFLLAKVQSYNVWHNPLLPLLPSHQVNLAQQKVNLSKLERQNVLSKLERQKTFTKLERQNILSKLERQKTLSKLDRGTSCSRIAAPWPARAPPKKLRMKQMKKMTSSNQTSASFQTVPVAFSAPCFWQKISRLKSTEKYWKYWPPPGNTDQKAATGVLSETPELTPDQYLLPHCKNCQESKVHVLFIRAEVAI